MIFYDKTGDDRKGWRTFATSNNRKYLHDFIHFYRFFNKMLIPPSSNMWLFEQTNEKSFTSHIKKDMYPYRTHILLLLFG
jgi:hypothetical protein